jgi:HAD superfamily hydrolase (TIGR01450 family)
VGRLTGIETVLLDLDGTLYVGSQVVPGAPEAVRWLRDQGLTVRFCTNTDSIPPAALADRLARLGLPATEEELVTPVAVAAQRFASTDEARVLAVAADGVRQLLAGCLAGPGDRVTHVLVADPSYGATYDDLDAGFRAVRAGAELVATQVNWIARRDDGEHLDTGRWVRLLEYATGQTARVLGKPSPEFFTAPSMRSAGGHRARWSWGTTWPPTSVVAGRSARPQCWSAVARVTAPAGRPSRAGRGRRQRHRPAGTAPRLSAPDRSPEDVDWCGGPAPSARLGRSTWNSATREAQRELSSPSRRRCGVQVVALHVGAQQQPEGHEVDQQL